MMKINPSPILAPQFGKALNLTPVWENLRPGKKEDRTILSETQKEWIRSLTSSMGEDDALVIEVCPAGTEAAFWVTGEERHLSQNMPRSIETVKATMPEAARQMACKLIHFLLTETVGTHYGQTELDNGILGVRIFKNRDLAEKEC